MSDAIVAADHCSKWYGHVLGISDVTWKLRGGIVGLLGPNGAGKSTLMKLMAGLLTPSRGTVTVFGAEPFHDVAVRRRIGYAPEHEKTWDELTALELVTAMAKLAGVESHRAHTAAEHALDAMGMTEARHRRVRGFSKGMRQRTKLATAIAHDPDVLLLDEPLTGVDPIARVDIVSRIRALAQAGKTIVVSSHVLYEIEALTSEIVVIHRGQVLAEGNVYEIRTLIDRHPHRIRVECDHPRAIATALAGSDHVAKLAFERGAIVIETRDPDRCYDQLAAAVLEHGVIVSSLASPDNNLGAVFEYLTTGGPTMTAPKQVPSALSSVLVLAGVTWTRVTRGRALWVSLFIGALPVLYAMMMGRGDHDAVGNELFAFEILVLAILAPMFVGSSIGEEIEDRTTTYLWSRPIPRWAILAGKLATLVPIVIVIGCASWLGAAYIAWHQVPPAQTFLAIALGAKAFALLATGIAMLAPKYGMALTICYLLFFDLPVGVLPATVQEASLSHQLRTLSGMWPADGTLLEGLIGIVTLAVVWTALAAWRIRRLEA